MDASLRIQSSNKIRGRRALLTRGWSSLDLNLGCLPLEDVPYTHLPFPLVRPPDACPETTTEGAASSVGTGRTGECWWPL